MLSSPHNKLGCIPTRVPLGLSVRGSHILRITEKNHSTYYQINSKQKKANKSYAKTKLQSQNSLNQLECDSAIGLLLLQNPDCPAHYHDRQFSILAKARTQFHLAALEAIFIKTEQPILCRQNEYVYSLQI